MNISRAAAHTPHRLHAIIRLVPKLKDRRKKNILNLVQPPKLIGENSKGKFDQGIASQLLSIALNLNLLQIDEDGESYQLHDSLQEQRAHIDKLSFFRRIMQERVTDPNSEHNTRMRRVTAWYAIQNERVFTYTSKAELARKYADEISEQDFSDEDFGFNDTQYNGWLQWASFLGWGWKMNTGFYRLVPNCSVRLEPLLPTLLPNKNEEISMNDFMKHLSDQCVELDDGIEFQRCWQESRPHEPRSNQLSLMLSSGLRTLEAKGMIKLVTYDDSPDVWHLYPAETMPTMITHILRSKGPK